MSNGIGGRVVAFTPEGVHRLKPLGKGWVYDGLVPYEKVEGCRLDLEGSGFVYNGIPGRVGVCFVQNGDASPRALDGYVAVFAAAGVLEEVKRCMARGGTSLPQHRAGFRASCGRVVTGRRASE